MLSKLVPVCAMAAMQLLGGTPAEDTWTRHMSEAAEQSAAGNYEQARLTYLAAVADAESFAADDVRRIRAVNNLGTVCYESARFEEAARAYDRALALWSSAGLPENDELARIVANLGALESRWGHYEKAETLLKRAIAIQERQPAEGLPASLNNLAELYRRQGRLADAERLFRRGISVWESLGRGDSEPVARALNNLAAAEAALGRNEDAERDYRRALALNERWLGAEHPGLAPVLNNFGKLLVGEGRLDEAVSMYRRALALQQKNTARVLPQTVATLNNLGRALVLQHQNAEAEAAFRQALEPAGGEEWNPALGGLASLYCATGRYQDALPLFERAVQTAERSFGRNSSEVADELHGAGETYRLLGRFGEAESRFREALAIDERLWGVDSPAITASLNSLAAVCADTGRLGEAESLLNRALTIRSAGYGDRDPRLLPIVRNLAEVELRLNRSGFAEAGFRRALELGEQGTERAHTLDRLAEICRAQHRFTEAEGYYESAIAIWSKTLPGPALAGHILQLAELDRADARMRAALRLYQQAAALLEPVPPGNESSAATAFNGIGAAQATLGNVEEAVAAFGKSADLIARQFGASDPRLATFLLNEAAFLRKLHHKTEAAAAEKRAHSILARRAGPPPAINSLR